MSEDENINNIEESAENTDSDSEVAVDRFIHLLKHTFDLILFTFDERIVKIGSNS